MILKMIKFDDTTKENIKEHNPNWLQIRDHRYGILKVGVSGSGISLFSLKVHYLIQ